MRIATHTRYAMLALFLALGMVLLALMLSQPVLAQKAKSGLIRKSVELTPTAAGNRVAAEGVAEIRKRGTLQEFGVDMETIDDATGKPVAGTEGMVFRVYVTNGARVHRGKTFLAGRIVMDKTGHGLLELSNDPVHQKDGARPLRRGVRPVVKIRTVKVVNRAGQTVLKGSF